MRCPLCSCPVQRTPGGELLDGLNAHRRVVHRLPGLPELPR